MLSAYGETGRAHIRRVAPEAGIVLKEGTLAYLPGPAFETRAELRYLASMGADLVGWSMAPEVMMAHALGMKTTGICCVSDISDPDAVTDADLDAIVGVCKASAVRLGKLLALAIERPIQSL
jgi:purine-nucleoside phosphorylase